MIKVLCLYRTSRIYNTENGQKAYTIRWSNTSNKISKYKKQDLNHVSVSNLYLYDNIYYTINIILYNSHLYNRGNGSLEINRIPLISIDLQHSAHWFWDCLPPYKETGREQRSYRHFSLASNINFSVQSRK